MILVYDERWNREPRPGFLRELKTQANTHLPVDSNCTLSGVESLTRQLDSQPSCDSEIIAFGGGGVLDKVKLAVLNQQSLIRPFVTRGRPGIAIIPHQTDAKVTLIPTTLGTGSEANSKAVLEVSPGRRRLVLFNQPKNFTYHHQPEAYASLSNQQVNHGILEILFRSAGTFVATPDNTAPVFLDYFLEAATYLKDLNHNLAKQQDTSFMTQIATLSARTHQAQIEPAAIPGGLMWVWPLWYFANELASLANITKLEATIPLTRPLITRIGKIGYGNPTKLKQLETTLSEPLTDFIDHHATKPNNKATTRLTTTPIDKLTTQTRSQWTGKHLPLKNIRLQEIAEVYRDVQAAYTKI